MPHSIDTTIACDRCDAICCRLTVVVMAGDDVPARFTDETPDGLTVMARDEEGWCVAIDQARMCCSIYESRPAICRRFEMGSVHCRDVRDTHHDALRRGIPLTMY